MSDNFAAAELELQRLISWQGSDPQSAYLNAVLARRTGRLGEFQQWLKDARQLGVSADLLALQSRFAEVQQGKIDTAGEVELSSQADRFASDDIALQTYEAVARGYLTTYRLKEAWQCIEYWLEWQPNTVSARFMRAEIAQRTGMPELAVEEYRKILEFNPDHSVVKEKLADSLLKLNEVDEAAELLRSVVEKAPNSSTARISLAEAERRLGNLDASKGAIDDAMQLGIDVPERAQCSTILGQLALANQQPAVAVEYLLAAVELAPQDAVSQLALGRALTLTGQKELGQRHVDQAQKVRDGYEQIQTWTRAVIDNPQDAELRVKIGQAMIDQGLIGEGIRWIKTALVCDPNYAPANELLQKMSITYGSVP